MHMTADGGGLSARAAELSLGNRDARSRLSWQGWVGGCWIAQRQRAPGILAGAPYSWRVRCVPGRARGNLWLGVGDGCGLLARLLAS